SSGRERCGEAGLRGLGIGGLEPGAGVDRPAALADLEVELRTAAAPAVAGGRDGVARCDRLAGRLVEPLVVPVEAQIPVPVVDDGEEPEPRQPVRSEERRVGKGGRTWGWR